MAAPNENTMISNKIMSGSGYECGKFAQEIHGRKQDMCGAIRWREGGPYEIGSLAHIGLYIGSDCESV